MYLLLYKKEKYVCNVLTLLWHIHINSEGYVVLLLILIRILDIASEVRTQKVKRVIIMLTKQRTIPIIVCEFHQEVLEFIHRYIAKKRLSFNQIKMIHFDSHPDLTFPHHLLADDCYDKHKMYNELDISDWILPLAYAGHLKSIVWLKPPWAEQIVDLTTTVTVGKEIETGKLRVNCTEDYFLEDGAFTTTSRLQNIQLLKLKVSQIDKLILQCQQKYKNITQNDSIEHLHNDETYRNDEQPESKRVKIDNTYGTESNHHDTVNRSPVDLSDPLYTNKETLEMDILPCLNDKYILDIDLDYFSVMNPFLQDYTENEYKKLKTIYSVTFPTKKDDENLVLNHVRDAQKKIKELESTIKTFAAGSNQTNGHQELLELLSEIKERKKGEDVDWAMVHSAGMTTDLPHHISSNDEIDRLVGEMVTLVKSLPRPAIISIARSTIDEYCPPHQIESIQEKVLNALHAVYEETEIILDYKDTSRII